MSKALKEKFKELHVLVLHLERSLSPVFCENVCEFCPPERVHFYIKLLFGILSYTFAFTKVMMDGILYYDRLKVFHKDTISQKFKDSFTAPQNTGRLLSNCSIAGFRAHTSSTLSKIWLAGLKDAEDKYTELLQSIRSTVHSTFHKIVKGKASYLKIHSATSAPKEEMSISFSHLTSEGWLRETLSAAQAIEFAFTKSIDFEKSLSEDKVPLELNSPYNHHEDLRVFLQGKVEEEANASGRKRKADTASEGEGTVAAVDSGTAVLEGSPPVIRRSSAANKKQRVEVGSKPSEATFPMNAQKKERGPKRLIAGAQKITSESIVALTQSELVKDGTTGAIGLKRTRKDSAPAKESNTDDAEFDIEVNDTPEAPAVPDGLLRPLNDFIVNDEEELHAETSSPAGAEVGVRAGVGAEVGVRAGVEAVCLARAGVGAEVGVRAGGACAAPAEDDDDEGSLYHPSEDEGAEEEEEEDESEKPATSLTAAKTKQELKTGPRKVRSIAVTQKYVETLHQLWKPSSQDLANREEQVTLTRNEQASVADLSNDFKDYLFTKVKSEVFQDIYFERRVVEFMYKLQALLEVQEDEVLDVDWDLILNSVGSIIIAEIKADNEIIVENMNLNIVRASNSEGQFTSVESQMFENKKKDNRKSMTALERVFVRKIKAVITSTRRRIVVHWCELNNLPNPLPVKKVFAKDLALQYLAGARYNKTKYMSYEKLDLKRSMLPAALSRAQRSVTSDASAACIEAVGSSSSAADSSVSAAGEPEAEAGTTVQSVTVGSSSDVIHCSRGLDAVTDCPSGDVSLLLSLVSRTKRTSQYMELMLNVYKTKKPLKASVEETAKTGNTKSTVKVEVAKVATAKQDQANPAAAAEPAPATIAGSEISSTTEKAVVNCGATATSTPSTALTPSTASIPSTATPSAKEAVLRFKLRRLLNLITAGVSVQDGQIGLQASCAYSTAHDNDGLKLLLQLLSLKDHECLDDALDAFRASESYKFFKATLFIPSSSTASWSNTSANGYCFYSTLFQLKSREQSDFTMSVNDMVNVDRDLFKSSEGDADRRKEFQAFLEVVKNRLGMGVWDASPEQLGEFQASVDTAIKSFASEPTKGIARSSWGWLKWIPTVVDFNCSIFTVPDERYAPNWPGKWVKLQAVGDFLEDVNATDVLRGAASLRSLRAVLSAPANFCEFLTDHFFVVPNPTTESLLSSFCILEKLIVSQLRDNVSQIAEADHLRETLELLINGVEQFKAVDAQWLTKDIEKQFGERVKGAVSAARLCAVMTLDDAGGWSTVEPITLSPPAVVPNNNSSASSQAELAFQNKLLYKKVVKLRLANQQLKEQLAQLTSQISPAPSPEGSVSSGITTVDRSISSPDSSATVLPSETESDAPGGLITAGGSPDTFAERMCPDSEVSGAMSPSVVDVYGTADNSIDEKGP